MFSFAQKVFDILVKLHNKVVLVGLRHTKAECFVRFLHNNSLWAALKKPFEKEEIGRSLTLGFAAWFAVDTEIFGCRLN